MAPAREVEDASITRELDIPEIIFSCGICQATPSEVYASPENNKGFHSGSGDDDGMVTRLWLSECMHVTCGRDLPDGAAPFHPHGQQPHAPCPLCIRDRGDDSPKDLFGIRGFGPGEHDAAIPESWFRCPPIKIEGADPGMDALRFQYVALTKYAQKVQRRWKHAEAKHSASEQSCAKERKRRKQTEAQLHQLTADAAANAAAHEKTEAQLKKWRDRQPVIKHYLGIVKIIADDMAEMRNQLIELGYHVPPRDYQFSGAATKEQLPPDNQPKAAAAISSSSTAVADRMELSSTSHRKRKQADRDQNKHVGPQRLTVPAKQRTTSRDMMPPPIFKPAQAFSQPIRSDSFRRAPQMVAQHGEDDVVMADRGSIASASPLRSRDAHSRSQNVPESRGMLHLHQSPTLPHEESTGLLEPFRFHSTAQAPGIHRRTAQRDPKGYLGQSQSAANSMEEHTNLFAQGHGLDRNSAAQRKRYNEMRHAPPASSWNLQSRDSPEIFAGSESRIKPTEIQNPFTPRTTSALKPAEPVAPSVISPFFKRNPAVSRTSGSQRPRTLADIYDQDDRHQGTSYHGTQRPEQHRHDPRPSAPQSSMSLYDTAPPSHASQAFTQSRLKPPTTTFQQRLQSAIPPTRDAPQQSVRARPFAPYMSSSQQAPASRPTSTFPRSRISLPPSTSRIGDVGLPTVPRIRGGFAQRVSNNYTQPGSSYQNSRTLFSAAGRRSVRR